MRDMDISFISLVKKGANKQKIQIYKADNWPETQPQEQEEMKGFFNVLKSFFSGKEPVAKENKAPTDFATIIANRDLNENLSTARRTLSDAIYNILNDEAITDKKTQIGTQIDAFKAYVLGELDRVGIKKAAELLETKIEIVKAGKKISTARLDSIKTTIQQLQGIVEEVEGNQDNEGVESQVKKEDIVKVVKEALDEGLKPITERLDNIEKGDKSEEIQTEINKQDVASVVKAALDEGLKSIEERLTVVEKARGISKGNNNDEDDKSKVNKGEETFDGYFYPSN